MQQLANKQTNRRRETRNRSRNDCVALQLPQYARIWIVWIAIANNVHSHYLGCKLASAMLSNAIIMQAGIDSNEYWKREESYRFEDDRIQRFHAIVYNSRFSRVFVGRRSNKTMHNRREHVQQANACLFVWFETKKEKTDGKHGKVINVSSDTSVQVQKKKTSFFFISNRNHYLLLVQETVYMRLVSRACG